MEIDKKMLNNIITILGTYGIIQVLAQDLGIKTGKKQRDLIQKQPVQFIMLYSGAFTVTSSHMNSLMTVFLYYFLKIVYSGGETSSVCFEEV